MQGPTDEAFIPTKYVINGRVVGGTLRRKNGIRTKPRFLPAVAENPALPLHPPPPLEDEDLPPAKRTRLQARDSNSTAANGVVHAHTAERVTTDSPDETPTDSVTPAASSPSAAASRAPPRSWTPQQDAKLTKAVKKHGKNWVAVAAMVPGRAREQCHQRWTNTVDPANGKKNVGKWKPEEDAELTEAVKKHGTECWVTIAAMVPGRTNRQCRERWVASLDPTIGKNVGKWKPEEDAELTKAVKEHGTECWVTIAALVPGRAREQCHQRWTNTLDPANGKKKGKWTPEENVKLTKAVKKHGKHWGSVAAMVPGRAREQCHQRWTNTLDPANGKKKGKWKQEEDAALTEAVKKDGTECWGSVAAMVPGRTNRQCRERWVRTLDPDRA
jgi:hypothetical protein